MSSTPPIKVLGIGAWDRSGSTVLANVLGAVPGVVSVGEINNLWDRGLSKDRPCGCGERFSHCPFWQPVIAEAFPPPSGASLLREVAAAGASLTNTQFLRHRLWGSSWPKAETYGLGLSALYRAIASISGARVIVDSSKIPWHLHVASELEGIEFTLLHLVRDPRGVVEAFRKKVAYDADKTSPIMMPRHGAVYTALGWRYRNLVLGNMWRRSRHRYFFERYEDFAADPAKVTRRILESVGHASDQLPFVSPQEAVIAPTHTVSGNPSRFTTGTVRIALDSEWRNTLSYRRRLLVEAVTWPMLARYGYHD